MVAGAHEIAGRRGMFKNGLESGRISRVMKKPGDLIVCHPSGKGGADADEEL
jgi:hypothetical protein